VSRIERESLKFSSSDSLQMLRKFLIVEVCTSDGEEDYSFSHNWLLALFLRVKLYLILLSRLSLFRADGLCEFFNRCNVKSTGLSEQADNEAIPYEDHTLIFCL